MYQAAGTMTRGEMVKMDGLKSASQVTGFNAKYACQIDRELTIFRFYYRRETCYAKTSIKNETKRLSYVEYRSLLKYR